MGYGALLSRMARHHGRGVKADILWTINHAAYDGWSNQLAAETLRRFVPVPSVRADRGESLAQQAR